jgi:hypothetical protein
MHAATILILTAAATVCSRSDVAADDDSSVRKTFDFAAPALNFEAAIPRDATVETVPMDAAEPGTMGNVKIIGKVKTGKNGPQVETTIVGYNLQAPAAALRICSFEAGASGYTPRLSKGSSDLTEVMLFANRADNGKPQSAAISYCFARAKQALAIHFIVDVSSAATKEAADELVYQTDDYARAFMESLSWGNGQESSFGEDLQTVPLRIGDQEMLLHIPNGWDVPINDFRGKLPAELHMIRRKGEKDVGLVWLFVQDRSEKPDLETFGTAIVKDYFVKQTPDTQPPVLIASEEDTALAEQGIDARTFRFSAANKLSTGTSDIEATVAWRDGRLSVLTLWSPWTSAADRNTFFSRLPGLTVYDIVRQATVTGAK